VLSKVGSPEIEWALPDGGALPHFCAGIPTRLTLCLFCFWHMTKGVMVNELVIFWPGL
jgi:hypothetical protein